MADTLELVVLLFAALREAVGCQEIKVHVKVDARVEDLLEALRGEHPQMASLLNSVAVAVNQEIAPPELRLQAGDEVALIPPVGGG